jgi:shikimate dehydrogenase
MHTAAFEKLGLDSSYEAIDVEPDDLPAAIGELRKRLAGFNVTLPHKESILPLLDELDPDAKLIGAVNTVLSRNGALIGYNTDVTGFLQCVEPVRSRIQEGHVAVLGAGGSARAVLYGLLRHLEPVTVTIFNRTLERSELLSQELESVRKGTRILTESLFDDALQNNIEKADVIINTTSVGMKPYADASPLEDVQLNKNQVVVDLIYTPLETRLLKSASKVGATPIGGLEMLLQQGAASFTLWTGKPMPVDEIRTILLEHLQ